jgi:hypothetical protein
MFAVLRRYRVRLGTVAQAVTQTEATLVPLLKQVPGFVAYYLLDTGDNIVAALTVFDSKPAAESASGLLSGWFRNDWPAFQLLPPDAGVAELASSGQAERRQESVARESLEQFLMTPRAPEVAGRRPRLDRRASSDRRVMGERRRVAVTPAVEQRSGTDRRSGVERRSGLERRAGRAGAQVDQVTPPHRIAPPSKRREPFRTT